MKAQIRWIENVCFLGEAESGHGIVLDGAPEGGGQNRGFRPMELLLVGLGGCTAFDVVQILKKTRQDINDCQVFIEAERAPTTPKVFTKIHLHFVVKGKNISSEQVRKAIDLSAEKYCSASKMLEKTAQISHDFEILDA